MRRLLDEAEQAEWSAVGRLNVAGRGFCTGSLVAADLVLTAAHCIADTRAGGVVRLGRVHFLAGYRLGRFEAHGRAAAIAIAPGFPESGLATDIARIRPRSAQFFAIFARQRPLISA